LKHPIAIPLEMTRPHTGNGKRAVRYGICPLFTFGFVLGNVRKRFGRNFPQGSGRLGNYQA